MEATQALPTSVPTLRPLRLGELLDRAIRLYRANFLTFIGIIAVVYVPLTVLQTAANALMTGSMFNRMSTPQELFNNYGYWAGLLASLILAFFQYILVQGIATGALTRAVSDNYLGKKTGILDAYRGIGRSWPSLLGALFLLFVLVIVLLIWTLVPCIGWLTGLGMLVFMSAVVSPLVAPAVVLENQGALDSIQRAWSLARRRFWPVLGYVFILVLFSWIVVNGPVAIVSSLLTPVTSSFSDPTTRMIVTSVIQGLVQLVLILLYLPLQLTAYTLIYFDLRVRTEGFDLAILTLETSGSADLSQAVAAPAAPVDESLITWPEMGSFAILELAGVGLYFLVLSVFAAIVLAFASLFR